MAGKKFFRCNVCNDIHYGLKPPRLCPTCNVENAYVEVTGDEASWVMKG
ncbi:rubredoxin-like domain-containing protein [Candidatus Altiarchaeota archaeon]